MGKDFIDEESNPIIVDLEAFYSVCELAINELREGAFEVGLWRQHNVESIKAIAEDALTIHEAIRIVKELIDPREEEDA